MIEAPYIQQAVNPPKKKSGSKKTLAGMNNVQKTLCHHLSK